MSNDQEPPTLNPFVPGGNTAVVNVLGEAYFAQSFRRNGVTGELLPEVARRIPTIANGGVVLNDDGTMTVSYQIRDVANWSDGTPISGDDYQFTYDTIMRDELPISKAGYEDITVTDVGPKRFAATFSRPSATYLNLFSIVIPKHAVEGTDFLLDWNNTMWPSGGPFEFAEWIPGESIRLVANHHYWGKDPDTGARLPFLDEVDIRFIPDTEAQLNAFRAREVDVYQANPDVGLLDELAALEPDGAQLQLGGAIWEHFNFQFGPNNRNTDTLNTYRPFRQAIAHGLDRTTMTADILGGYGRPLNSFFEAYNPAFTGLPWSQYDHDPEAAIRLIEQACIEALRDCDANPPSVVFSTTRGNTARARMAEFVDEYLTAIGIDVTIELEDSSLFFGPTLNDGTWDLGEWAWLAQPDLASGVQALTYFDPDGPCHDGRNCYQWGTPGSSVINANTERFAQIVDEATSEVDERALIRLFKEAEQILADDAVIIPLYVRPSAAVVWADSIAGVSYGPYNESVTWNIGEWRRAEPVVVDPGMCDFNGDGVDDAAFASPGEAVGDADGAGMVQEIRGRLGEGVVNRRDVRVWTQGTDGVKNEAERNDRFGEVLACGDFDGDGFGDLAVGVPGEGIGGEKGAGGVAVLYGNRFGLKAAGNQFWHQDSDGVADSAEAGDGLGSSLTVGDFNGDGYHDLAIGVPGESFAGEKSRGGVAVLYGGTSGLAPEGNRFVPGDAGPDAAAGMALAAADWNRDGIDDLAVGAPGATVNGAVGAGAVTVIPGSDTGLDVAASVAWTQDTDRINNRAETRDAFGSALAAGDFDGDRRIDLAVGAPGESLQGVFQTGLVHVIYGRADGLNAARDDTISAGRFLSLEAKERFGSVLAVHTLTPTGSGREPRHRFPTARQRRTSRLGDRLHGHR